MMFFTLHEVTAIIVSFYTVTVGSLDAQTHGCAKGFCLHKAAA